MLDIAKGIYVGQRREAPSQDEIELVLAWARDEITFSQATKAWEKGTGKGTKTGFYTVAAYVLKDEVKNS